MNQTFKLTVADQRMVDSINKHSTAQNITLRTLGHKGIKDVYSGQDSDLLNAVINAIKFDLRKPFASWLSVLGINVTEVERKAAGKSGVYTVQRIARNPKMQEKVLAMIKADETPAVLREDGRTYKEPTKKVLSDDAIEITKRAKEGVAKFIKSLKERDPAAAAIVNQLWAARTELALVDGAGHAIPINEVEATELVSALQAMRKDGSAN